MRGEFNPAAAEFARLRAIANGQTADRVIPASEPLPRSNESEVFRPGITKVEMGPPTCACRCGCDNLTTIEHPRRCRECAFGQHVRV